MDELELLKSSKDLHHPFFISQVTHSKLELTSFMHQEPSTLGLDPSEPPTHHKAFLLQVFTKVEKSKKSLTAVLSSRNELPGNCQIAEP